MTTAVTPKAQDDELPEGAFDILVAAVNVARNEQTRTVASLKLRLASLFPKTPESTIDATLRHWARHLAATGAHLS